MQERITLAKKEVLQKLKIGECGNALKTVCSANWH